MAREMITAEVTSAKGLHGQFPIAQGAHEKQHAGHDQTGPPFAHQPPGQNADADHQHRPRQPEEKFFHHQHELQNARCPGRRKKPPKVMQYPVHGLIGPYIQGNSVWFRETSCRLRTPSGQHRPLAVDTAGHAAVSQRRTGLSAPISWRPLPWPPPRGHPLGPQGFIVFQKPHGRRPGACRRCPACRPETCC